MRNGGISRCLTSKFSRLRGTGCRQYRVSFPYTDVSIPLMSSDRESREHLQDLGRARVVTSALVNGVPQTHVELAEGVRKHVLAEALSTVEQQWLAAQINEHIEVCTSPHPA